MTHTVQLLSIALLAVAAIAQLPPMPEAGDDPLPASAGSANDSRFVIVLQNGHCRMATNLVDDPWTTYSHDTNVYGESIVGYADGESVQFFVIDGKLQRMNE